MICHIWHAMNYLQEKFEYRGCSLAYLKAGTGSNYLLAFHGFGQNHAAFSLLASELALDETLISFDLFFHGNSYWPYEDDPLTKEFWSELLQQFVKQNNIGNFSIIGYSLGAKLAFASLEAIPEKVKALYLIAPDGIRENFWYRVATHPLIAKSLFKSLIKKPDRFLTIIQLAQSMRMINSPVARFAKSQMDTDEKRERVYRAWMVFRKLNFNMNRVAEILNARAVSSWVLVGTADRIITPETVRPLTRKVKKINIKLIATGHNNLIAESVKELRNIRH